METSGFLIRSALLLAFLVILIIIVTIPLHLIKRRRPVSFVMHLAWYFFGFMAFTYIGGVLVLMMAHRK